MVLLHLIYFTIGLLVVTVILSVILAYKIGGDFVYTEHFGRRKRFFERIIDGFSMF
jgi:hypothetical protein